MKKCFKFLKFAVSLLAISLFAGCETGLGSALDLEAPEITVTSPEKFSYQKLAFELSGTCKDNVGITSMVISNKETGKVYGNARINGETWTFPVNLSQEEEGEITFQISATDAFGNTSTRSIRTITLLVDEHAPEAKSWYIERGVNIRSELRTKEELEEFDLNLAVNKDVAQNQKFTIHGDFYDAMSIDTITLKLFDETVSDVTPIAEKTVRSDSASPYFIGEGKSIYSPAFEFKDSDLSTLGNGKHYLKLKYYTKDNDSLENSNANEVDTEKYVLWYPESDYPGIQQTQIKNGKIQASVGGTIPIDFFDDDALSEIYAALKLSIPGGVTVDQFAAKLKTDASARTSAFNFTPGATETKVEKTFTNDSTRDDPQQLKCPELPNVMYLIACAKDINGKWSSLVVPAEIIDSSKPLLFIESPSENTIPEIEAGTTDTFKIKGYSLDTKGSNFIKFVYIPDSPNYPNNAAKENRAKQLLDQYKDDRTAKKTIAGTGEVIWCKSFSAGEDQNGWNKQSFEISMALLSDFKNAGANSTAKDIKFFEVLLEDSDENKIYKTFLLNGDSTLPGVNIISPAVELDVHDYTVTGKKLTIEFKAEKPSGLGIKNDDYMVSTKIGDTEYKYYKDHGLTVDASGKAKVEIANTVLSDWAKTEAQPTFTFYATDVLGNGAENQDGTRTGIGQRSVILSPRPVINSITVDKNNGTYKAGDVLKFKVTFSKQVKVTGKPRLKILYKTNDTAKYAEYETGSGSNALTFKFTVPEGADSKGIICDGFDVEEENKFASGIKIQATELGEGDIYTSLKDAEVLKGKEIKLDGIAPSIESITVTATDGNNFCTKDKEIKAVVKMSENILVSGSPILVLKTEKGNVNFTFQSMKDNELTFVHIVKDKATDTVPKTNEGLLKTNVKTCFSVSDAKFISDTNGNLLKLAGDADDEDTIVEIDYTAPATAPKHNLTASVYNTDKDIVLSEYEDNAVAYFSTDGGVSWINYNTATAEEKHLSNKKYTIVTKQMDRAGNVSGNSDKKEVTINSTFAPVTGFTVGIGDGNHKAGTEFTFKLYFDEKVKISDAADLRLKFKSSDGKKVSDYINVEVPDDAAKEFTFNYTVKATDSYTGVEVSEILFANTVRDEYNNAPSYDDDKLTPDNCQFLEDTAGGKRAGITLDGVAPSISVYAPVNGGVYKDNNATRTDNSSGKFKVVLTFSEHIEKEEGQIILQRKGDWAIPPVFTSAEFVSIYNKLSKGATGTREKLMKTITGDGSDISKESTDAKTGQPVGPYKKITHGLKTSGTKLVPDTETKYVLDFKYGLVDDLSETDKTVSDIREALKSIDYDKHFVDVNSSGVTIKDNSDGTATVTITFAETIEDGREWNLVIPQKAFRDNAENFYKGMNLQLLSDATITAAQKNASDKYSLWSDNVATPVVRLDRYSHGWGAQEPNASGALTTITNVVRKYTTNVYSSQTGSPVTGSNAVNTTGRGIAPTGYARVRVDCETIGANIFAAQKAGSVATVAAGDGAVKLTKDVTPAMNNGSYCNGKVSENADITKAILEATTLSQYNGYIIVGDGSYLTARKDYVVAKATKTGFKDSAFGYDGVFKTVVYTNVKGPMNIEGGTSPGGEPSVSGFPLRDGTDASICSPYSKNAYKIGTSERYVWVSYEFVSTDFAILLCQTGHSAAYPLCSYGQGVYVSGLTGENGWTN